MLKQCGFMIFLLLFGLQSTAFGFSEAISKYPLGAGDISPGTIESTWGDFVTDMACSGAPEEQMTFCAKMYNLCKAAHPDGVFVFDPYSCTAPTPTAPSITCPSEEDKAAVRALIEDDPNLAASYASCDLEPVVTRVANASLLDPIYQVVPENDKIILEIRDVNKSLLAVAPDLSGSLDAQHIQVALIQVSGLNQATPKTEAAKVLAKQNILETVDYKSLNGKRVTFSSSASGDDRILINLESPLYPQNILDKTKLDRDELIALTEACEEADKKNSQSLIKKCVDDLAAATDPAGLFTSQFEVRLSSPDGEPLGFYSIVTGTPVAAPAEGGFGCSLILD